MSLTTKMLLNSSLDEIQDILDMYQEADDLKYAEVEIQVRALAQKAVLDFVENEINKKIFEIPFNRIGAFKDQLKQASFLYEVEYSIDISGFLNKKVLLKFD